MVVINIGKKSNFKCSQVLSFIALNVPINKLLLDKWNAKCRKTPNIEQNIKENILNCFIDNFFIFTPPYKIYTYYIRIVKKYYKYFNFKKMF